MSKYWKRTINKGEKKNIVHRGGGGFEVGWTWSLLKSGLALTLSLPRPGLSRDQVSP